MGLRSWTRPTSLRKESHDHTLGVQVWLLFSGDATIAPLVSALYYAIKKEHVDHLTIQMLRNGAFELYVDHDH